MSCLLILLAFAASAALLFAAWFLHPVLGMVLIASLFFWFLSSMVEVQ